MELTMANHNGCNFSIPINRDFEECEFVMNLWLFEDTYWLSECEEYDTMRLVMPESSNAINPRNKTIYMFVYDDENSEKTVKNRHAPLLENEDLIAVVIDVVKLQILFNTTKLTYLPWPIRCKLRKKIEFHESVAKSLFIPLLALLCYFLFYRLIKAYEGDDPSFEDFQIMSGEVMPYNNVSNKECQSCMICIETFTDEDSVRMLPCSHVYHSRCIDIWLIGHLNRCPYCRQEVEISQRA
ncbi:hypothetical protein PAEPH01_0077 [Pancytospora epiphaga]|nr:hypothetical protein PAEPH01_0077 [Pancytospora epiphaga]